MKKLLIIASLLSITSLYGAKQQSATSDNKYVKPTRIWKRTIKSYSGPTLEAINKRDAAKRANQKKRSGLPVNPPSRRRLLFGPNS